MIEAASPYRWADATASARLLAGEVHPGRPATTPDAVLNAALNAVLRADLLLHDLVLRGPRAELWEGTPGKSTGR
jgi:hypothetical protein